MCTACRQREWLIEAFEALSLDYEDKIDEAEVNGRDLIAKELREELIEAKSTSDEIAQLIK